MTVGDNARWGHWDRCLRPLTFNCDLKGSHENPGKNENVHGKHFIVESYSSPTSRAILSTGWYNAFMLRLKIQHFSGKPEVFPCSQENALPQ